MVDACRSRFAAVFCRRFKPPAGLLTVAGNG
jgi:hypothetical protein